MYGIVLADEADIIARTVINPWALEVDECPATDAVENEVWEHAAVKRGVQGLSADRYRELAARVKPFNDLSF
jgi:hypothetical protein